MISEIDVSQAVKAATGPLRIVGGGTRGMTDNVAGDVLSMAGHSGIALYEPGALTLVAKTGTPLSEIDAALAAQGQRLAFEPPDMRALMGTDGTPTIGGAIATNSSGPRRVVAGAARDFLLGVRFVDGAGTIVKNGGRVMKNVTGYDLVKLMCGAHGTLGVLTEVSLKVLPVAQTQLTLQLSGITAQVAVTAMSAALGSPFEVSGAAYGAVNGAQPAAVLRIEGFEASVHYRAAQLRAILAAYGAVDSLDATASATVWAAVRDVTPLAETLTATSSYIWRISVKPSAAPRVLAALPAPSTTLLDWGGGRIWLACPQGSDVRTTLSGIPGHATLVRGTASATTGPVFPPEPAPIAAIAAGLRAKFDPRGILNPGLMGPGPSATA